MPRQPSHLSFAAAGAPWMTHLAITASDPSVTAELATVSTDTSPVVHQAPGGSAAVVAADDLGDPAAAAETGRRAHCGCCLPRPARRGRQARFCSHRCREAARLRRELDLPESVPRVRTGGRLHLRDRLGAWR